MLNYSYNGQGYLTDSSCEINSLKPSKYYSYATTYDYDKSGRILQENKLKNSNFENRYTYSYNEDGSINEITNYSYNSNTSSTKEFNYKFGRLENIKEGTHEINIEYDNCGNCTSINNNGTLSTFEWTRGHLLNKFTKNNIEVNYNYNAFGQRVSKKVGDYNYDYYYNGDKLKVQFRYDEGDSRKNQTLVFLYDNDEIVGLYYVERQQTYEFIKDCQGNVVSILYGGEELAHYVYDYFGNCTVYSNGNIDTDQDSIGLINPIRYRGYYYDVETSLFWLSSRYYSPELCRFISPDDVEYLDPESVNGLNLYAYCRNYDPNGTFDLWEFFRGVGNIVTGALAIVVGAIVLIGGAPIGMLIVAGITVGAGVLTLNNGIADIVGSFTGYNYMSDGLFNGNTTAYNWYSGITSTVAVIGTAICGDFIKKEYFMRGAAFGTEGKMTLQPGMELDRYGSKYGRFLTNPGTAPDQLSLPASNNLVLNHYKVLKPFNVATGIVDGGGGFQYFTWRSVHRLIQMRYLAII